MNKITNKILALFLCAVMLFAPIAVYAEDAALGSEANPYVVTASDARGIRFSVQPGMTMWVKADIGSSTVTIGYASTSNYRVSYNGRNYLPETESGENTLHFGISDKNIPFTVTNTGSESVLVCIQVAPGEYVDPTGTANYPELVVLEENPRTGLLYAFLAREIKSGSGAYYFTVKAPAEGAISVSVTATDAEWNDLGWSFNAGNKTTGIYGATHHSTDEPYVDVEHIRVSAGDEVIVAASTFDPETPFAPPVGNIYVSFSFSELGTLDCPEVISEIGSYSKELKKGNDGFYYTWTAEAAGTVTIEMLDAAGWQYLVTVAHVDGSYTYGEKHAFNDSPVIPYETHEVEAGDVFTILIATSDPTSWATNPEGTVNWKLSFTEDLGTIFGDTDGDEEITTKDVLTIRKAIGGLIELTAEQEAAADCDGDGEITTKDVLAIRKFLGGLIDELPIA